MNPTMPAPSMIIATVPAMLGYAAIAVKNATTLAVISVEYATALRLLIFCPSEGCKQPMLLKPQRT